MYDCTNKLALLTLKLLFAFRCLLTFWHLSVWFSDGVGVGQRWAHRADRSQVHGPAEDGAARLVPEHGGRRDVAERHLSQESPQVGGPHARPPGRVPAPAPEITGVHTQLAKHTHTHTHAMLHLWISHAQHTQHETRIDVWRRHCQRGPLCGCDTSGNTVRWVGIHYQRAHTLLAPV